MYAVDIQPEMIALLKRNVENAGLASVVPVLGTGDDPRLPAGGVDWILLVDVYHELQQPKAMLARMREALAPGGRIALVEYRLVGSSAEHIRKVELVEYPELGMEAIYKIEVVDFPAYILVDDKGNDFFQKLT